MSGVYFIVIPINVISYVILFQNIANDEFNHIMQYRNKTHFIINSEYVIHWHYNCYFKAMLDLS